MERLIYSSSSSISKTPFLPQFHSFKTHQRSGFSPPPPPPRVEFLRSSALVLFSKSEDFLSSSGSSSSSSSFLSAKSPIRCSIKDSSLSSSSSAGDLPDRLRPSFPLLQQIAGVASRLEKPVSAGAVILLSALLLIFAHPVLAPQAYATVQSGGSATAAAVVGGRLLRTELLSSAWTGFFAGCLHTLSGPDHLAALAPLSIGRTRIESAAVGALWGCGHDAGQVIFGLLFLLLKDRLHIEIIRTWGTRVVGFTLLVIGAMGIREATEVPTPCVALENGECETTVLESLEAPKSGKKKIGFATFATGIVHGLQPDALMMVLPALALPSRLAGAAFLGMFLVGTVIAMGSYTVFIGSCSQALKERVPRITEKLTWASSLIAIALGLAIIISQFFGFSLY